MPPATDPRVVQLMSASGRVVPVVGAGISTGSGWPAGDVLAAHLRDRFGLTTGTSVDPRKVASAIVSEHLGTQSDVRLSVAEFFRTNVPSREPSRALQAVAACASGWVVTINYDDSIERAGRSAGRTVRSYTWEDLPDADEAAVGAEHPLNVLHAHGHIDEPESIVLTDGVYQSVEGHADMRYLLAQLFLSHQACIFGSKMDEVWLYQFFTRLSHRNARHVLLAPAGEAEALQTRLAIDEGQHIVIQTFPDQDWVWLDRAAEVFLLPSSEPIQELPAAALCTPPVVADFVLPVVAAVNGTGDLDSSLLPYQVEMDPSKRLTLEDLAAKNTAVVVGRPGSGKTQMLRQIASAVPESDRAVYVRLGQTRSLVGAPEAFLLAWLRDARQVGSEQPIAPELLHSNRFHFLLDGLDARDHAFLLGSDHRNSPSWLGVS
jgi:SIR2-like domain